jgi:hypothetical protein
MLGLPRNWVYGAKLPPGASLHGRCYSGETLIDRTRKRVLNRRTLHVALRPPDLLLRGRMQSQQKPNTLILSADLRKPSHKPVGRPRRDFFGLRHNPFDLTPDPRFLHRTKQAH